MLEIINFLSANWQIVSSGVLLVFSLILALVRKRPVNDIEMVIFRTCVMCIIETENAGILGADNKLKHCVELVNNNLLVRYPNLDITRYYKFIVACIEFILCSPQKKEV